MLSQLKYRLIKIPKVAGIEISILPENKMEIALVILSSQKNVLVTEKKVSGLENLEQLKEHVSNDIPLSVAINGRGILHKKIVNLETEDPNLIIQNVLPNAKAIDFYIQQYQVKDATFVSVVRRNLLDAIIQKISACGFFIISKTLGPFTVANIFPLMGIENGTVSFHGHQIIYEDSGIREYKYVEADKGGEGLFIGDERMSGELILPYASAFQTLVSSAEKVEVYIEEIKRQQGEFIHKKLFKILGWSALIFFLSVLMINFFLFDQFSKKNKELSMKGAQYRGMVSRLDTLTKNVKEKEQFLTTAGWLNVSKASFYADRIASSVPGSIRLTELAVNPIDKMQSKSERKLLFENGYLNIGGNCSRPTDLNPWIKKIKSMKWVSNVAIENYSFDNKDKAGEFNLRVTLKQ